MCKEVCPVDIDIPRMLLDLRHELVQQGPERYRLERGDAGLGLWQPFAGPFCLGGKLAAKLSGWLKPKSLPGPLRGWTQARSAPRFAPKSFHQLWQEREKGGDNEQS
jgi:L-lactate dehydrogenase complex protein LldF